MTRLFRDTIPVILGTIVFILCMAGLSMAEDIELTSEYIYPQAVKIVSGNGGNQLEVPLKTFYGFDTNKPYYVIVSDPSSNTNPTFGLSVKVGYTKTANGFIITAKLIAYDQAAPYGGSGEYGGSVYWMAIQKVN